MSTNRWVNPISNNLLWDDEGNLLPGGSLEFFEAGTSTPLIVYSDTSQTASLGDTLTADAYGLIEDFHLPSGTQFKAVCKDSLAVTKWTRDYLFTADSDTDTRLDSLETSVAAISGVTENGIVNGGMKVALGSVLTLTSSFLEGKVNRLFGRVTNVTAGTLTQGASADYTSGSYAHFSGVSTSATSVVEGQIRVPAIESQRYANRQVTFSCLVYQDTGSSKDYTVTIKKADVSDVFSALTTIQAGTATAVATGTNTRLTLTVSDMGACETGIAIEISAAVTGAITTKNFRISEAQLETGGTRSGFSSLPAEVVERGAIAPGTILQTARSESDVSPGYVLVTGVIPADNTIPQDAEGDELLTVSITPKYANSKIRIKAYVPAYLATGSSIGWAIAIFKDSGADALAATRGFDAQGADNLYVEYEETLSSASAITYKLRCGECPSTADDLYVGSYYPSARLFGGINRYWLSVEEIAS